MSKAFLLALIYLKQTQVINFKLSHCANSSFLFTMTQKNHTKSSFVHITLSMFCFAFSPPLCRGPKPFKLQSPAARGAAVRLGGSRIWVVLQWCTQCSQTLGRLHWGKQALSHTDKPWQPMQVIKAELCRERLGTARGGGGRVRGGANTGWRTGQPDDEIE